MIPSAFFFNLSPLRAANCLRSTFHPVFSTMAFRVAPFLSMVRMISVLVFGAAFLAMVLSPFPIRGAGIGRRRCPSQGIDPPELEAPQRILFLKSRKVKRVG